MTDTIEQAPVDPNQTTIEEQAAAAEAEKADKEKTEYRSKANQAYNAAWSKLREKYRKEYDEMLDAEFEARGLVHRKRATSEQAAEKAEQERLAKAKEKMNKLLTDFPALAQGLGQQAPQQ